MPTPATFEALRDLQAFVKLSESGRAQLAADVAEALGDDWRAITEPTTAAAETLDALPLKHERTDLVFHVVPGGVFRMGLSADDVAAFDLAIESTGPTKKLLERFEKILRPVRTVTVDPFLVTAWPIPYDVVRRISNGRYRRDTFDRVGALDFVHSAGFRLPSESEHQWLARDGRQLAFPLDCVASVRARREPHSRFGIKNLHFEEWMEDDWHPTYEGAPTNSSPWLNGDPRGVYRGGLLLSAVQSASEYVFGLAALRFPGPRKGPDHSSSEITEVSLQDIEEAEDPDALVRFVCPLPESFA